MKFQCLGTGSSGNCYLVNLGGGYVLLDAGIPFTKLSRSVNLNDVDFCFISHMHKDHSLCINKLNLRGVHIKYGNLVQDFTKSELKSKFGGLYKIFTFPVIHDDCKCAGIIIMKGSQCVLYVTDFTICKYDLSFFKFTSVIVECNYIKENAIDSDFTRSKENIYRHLSLDGCELFLSKLDLSKCNEIILTHFSSDYSDPIYMGSYINNKFKIKTLCCRKFGGYDTYE